MSPTPPSMLASITPVFLPFIAVLGLVWALTGTALWRSWESRGHAVYPTLVWLATSWTLLSTFSSKAGSRLLPSLTLALATPVLALTLLSGALATPRGSRPRKMSLILIGLLSYLATQVISAFHNGQISQAFATNLTGLTFTPLLFVCAWQAPTSNEELLRLAYRITHTVVALSLFLAVAAPALAYQDPRRFPLPSVPGRLSGLTPHPNFLAATAALSLLLTLAIRPKLRSLSVSVSILAIILAEARGVAVALLASLLVQWAVQRGLSPARLILGSVSAWLAISDSIANVDPSGGRQTGLASDIATFNSRTEVWTIVAQHFTNARMLGWGPAAFNDAAHSPFASTYFLHAHSQLMQSMAEGGAFGLASFLLIFLGMLVIAVKNVTHPPFSGVFMLATITMITEVPLTSHLYGLGYPVVFTGILLSVFAAGVTSASPRISRCGTTPVRRVRTAHSVAEAPTCGVYSPPGGMVSTR